MAAPQITRLSPGWVRGNDPDFILHVLGTEFYIDSVITVNGVDAVTKYVSFNELTTPIQPSTISAGTQSVPIRVRAVVGGLSNTVNFVFIRESSGMASSPYPSEMRPGSVGAIASMEGERLISRTVQDVGGLTFGLAVQAGTVENTCVLGTTGPFIGVTVQDRGVTAEFPLGFAQYATARIMTSGVLWVMTAEAVLPTDAVKFDPATGLWGKTTGTAFGIARFETRQTAAGLAKLSLSDTHLAA